MTQKQFDTEIRRLMRRADLLREANSGRVKLHKVDVGACTVRSHDRAAHTRYIAPTGWKPRKS